MRTLKYRSLLLCLVSIPGIAVAQNEGTRLLRYPDIHQDTIAFVYSGDLWRVESTGGVARRLTSHEGLELFPKFSPDGRWIAFSAEYSGTRQVHVIPAEGGAPRQLTYYNDVGQMPPRGGFDNQVLGWTPDGEKVLFRANRLPWGVRMGRPYQVPVAGGMEEPLPIPESGGGMLSPDGSRFVYTPISREFRTWKRYHGGRAQDVWIYDLVANTAEQITDFEGTDSQPVWVGETIYFTSDREHTLNLYAYDPATKLARKVTQHDEYDVLWPSAGPQSIVYESGGWLYRFDPASETSQQVPVQVYGDLPHTVPYFKNVKENIHSADLSPSGKRAVFGARGEVFTVPAQNGEIRNLTRSSGVREIYPTWSPDGQWIAYLSDRSGEYELYLRSSDGSGEERRLTHDGDIWRFPPVWSPDAEKLAFADKRQRLLFVEIDSGRLNHVDQGQFNDITTYRWSPDSHWLVYEKVGPSRLPSIWLYSLERGEPLQLTGDDTADYDPVFDPQGRYLYFLSDRDFNLTFSGFEFDYLYTDPTRVYVGLLAADGPALFLPKSDEEEKAEGESGNADPEKAEPAEEDEPKKVRLVEIDPQGFETRVRAIPGPSADYRALTATEKGALYLVGEGAESALKLYDLESEKEAVILQGIGDYQVSGDGQKVLFRHGEEYGIADLKPDQKASEGRLDLDQLVLKIVPLEEWSQMYVDGWRILRDWFYDPGLHGADWELLRQRYGQLVPHLAHRADLDFIFGELGGELNAGHVYVQSGDEPAPERIEGGLLGAEIEAHESGYFRVARIFPGENWHEDFRSPLTEPGVDVKVGDFLLAVDGRSTSEIRNFYELMESKGGQVVTLLVNDKPSPEGARQERVRPIQRETNLRYLDWVQANREHVERQSQGRIGYIHLPNTAAEGNRELFKHFYPQAHKDALIIDVRYNGGGFIPGRMIELLNRPLLNYWARRGIEPFTTPGFAHQGPKVCLINGLSSSGGDAFPYYFRKVGLGRLIGTRTWGGLIGLSGNPALADGGSILTPTFRFFDTDGLWAVEGEGVTPDIEAVDRPDLVAKGQRPVLDKAIEVLLEELERLPQANIQAPEAPQPEQRQEPE